MIGLKALLTVVYMAERYLSGYEKLNLSVDSSDDAH